ncbi:MAG: hypothetical protein H0W15_10260 [Gemmatimonadales bacterium]|nr:hypothetical protein [Gemmatimonadales bacterium]
MHRIVLAFVVASISAVVPVAAQSMADGRWRGDLVSDAGDQHALTFVAEHRKGKLFLTMTSPEAPDVAMGGVKLKRGYELTFTWAGGANAFYFCRLTRRAADGPFDGSCVDNRVSVGNGPVSAALTLHPPEPVRRGASGSGS